MRQKAKPSAVRVSSVFSFMVYLYAATGEIRPGTAITCHREPQRVAALRTFTVSPVAFRVAVTVMMSGQRLTVALGMVARVARMLSSWAVFRSVGSDFIVISPKKVARSRLTVLVLRHKKLWTSAFFDRCLP